jgi:diguanylate cyclase (GGDEF)-like protein
MRLHSPGLSARFFVALGVLLIGLAAVGLVATSGLQRVQGANDQVFSDNYLTAATTSQLSNDLARVEVVSLQLAATTDPIAAARLRTHLDQIEVPKVNAALAILDALHRDDPGEELRTISRIRPAWERFLALTRNGTLGVATPGARAAAVGILDPLIALVVGLQSVESDAAASAHARATGVFERSRIWLLVVGAVAIAAALTLVRIGLALRKLVEYQSAEQLYAESESEYIDTLQVTENEDEAQELLRRHVERSVNGARAVVLARNNSADRLEPKTSLVELDALREPLVGATPRACLAVRFGRTHVEGGSHDPLMHCDICGSLAGVSSCEPLLVGGEVIGAVLINQDSEPETRNRQLIREAVGQAAPVLANLRNLAIAQLRASTDALTGLPNQRAVQDTLKRMVAQASRTISPLAALLIDLDHFKEINDIYGHDRGDEVLAAVGVAFKNIVRDSDFIGRYGGEEFLLLLPATNREGAIQVAEAVRHAIAAITLPGIDRPITASVGVAVLPDDAGDSVTLFRSADRALYAAKQNGRNRVESTANESMNGQHASIDAVVEG